LDVETGLPASIFDRVLLLLGKVATTSASSGADRLKPPFWCTAEISAHGRGDKIRIIQNSSSSAQHVEGQGHRLLVVHRNQDYRISA